MESALHQQVIGQSAAVNAVANAVCRFRTGLADPNRSNGSLLFLGPTGADKTELCKPLAHFLFDTAATMMRIDMSGFMKKHAISRLISALLAMWVMNKRAIWTEAVRRRPYAVLFLDEIEKAHANVLNILLKVLEDGRLKDSQGRTVDFRNTVIVMTSNIGSDVIQTMTSENQYYTMLTRVISIVEGYFRPELLNRIDELVVFYPLGKRQLADIANI